MFLGCAVAQPQPLTSVIAKSSGGAFTAGGDSYEITAATAYGESALSTAQTVTVGANDSVTLSWPEATNGIGQSGAAGPTLAQDEANHTGRSGFWGYGVYRENPGTTTYGLVGQVAENPATIASTTYSLAHTGATAPRRRPGLGPALPDDRQPGHRLCHRRLAGGRLATAMPLVDDGIAGLT